MSQKSLSAHSGDDRHAVYPDYVGPSAAGGCGVGALPGAPRNGGLCGGERNSPCERSQTRSAVGS